ncbi:MAG: hypothetical protein H7333_10745 [Bdellovibrionales bacterium]|nr:hypothetical protein [Oligoflexia bacterium]
MFLRVFSARALHSGLKISERRGGMPGFLMLMTTLLSLSACSTSDSSRLKESRNFYLQDDFAHAEASLYTPEVFKYSQNRLQHFYLLSSLAMSQGEFEKANYFLNRARETANSVRSASGVFEWFSSDYRSNPLEYSYIHSMLVMSYTLLAEAGRTPAWNTPEIKDEKGNTLVDAQIHVARTFSAKEVAELKQKARAELLAWDSFLENLKRTYPEQDYYKEDLWARVLASYLHGVSSDNNEKRTAELLADDARRVFTQTYSAYPSAKSNGEQVSGLIDRLKKRAQNKQAFDTMLVLEAGVIGKYKIKRFHLGLSTLFKNIQDPGLRSMMEQIGIQALFNAAPEFGLVLFSGGLAGAVTSGDEDDENEGPPRFFSDAVDRSFGFEIRFPTLVFPPADTRIKLTLIQPGKTASDFSLPIVSPLQEMVATELKQREQKEMFTRAIRIGSQYLGILIPAIQAYKAADREGNVFKKLAILAGYYIGKKAIDNANQPDLRSWNYLPQVIAAEMIPLPPGEYDAKVTLENQFGRDERSVGKVTLGNPARPIIRARVGNVPILNQREAENFIPVQ